MADWLTAKQMNNKPVLELRGVSKNFGAVRALYNVDFTCKAGEVATLDHVFEVK